MTNLRRRLRETEERLRQRDEQRARQHQERQALNAETGQIMLQETDHISRLTPEQRAQHALERQRQFEQEELQRQRQEDETLWEGIRSRAQLGYTPFRGINSSISPQRIAMLQQRLDQWRADEGVVDRLHVHTESRKLNNKIPMIYQVIKKYIPPNDYSNFIDYLDSTLKVYLETSEDFEQKTVNSQENKSEANPNKKYKARLLKKRRLVTRL